MQKFCPSGIYVLPILDDIKSKIKYILIITLVWQGVIFIKEGPYKGGMYKFEIRFPQNYPLKHPEVFFINKIIHPLIQDNTGKLDITVRKIILIVKLNRKNFQTGSQEKILLSK